MSMEKSFSNETSERYSRALYEVAEESNELEKVEKDIKNFLLIFNNSPEVKNFIKDPTLNINLQKNVIKLITDKLSFSKNLKNFLFLLIEKRRIFFVNKISETFLKICSQERGEVKASLISSKELSTTEREKIGKDLSDSMGKKLKFEYVIDKELIGGLKLQVGSFMIDTSIKNMLKKYEQAMLES